MLNQKTNAQILKVEADKKIEAIAKKAQAKKLNEISEVNIFKDDNTVIHFKKPTLV